MVEPAGSAEAAPVILITVDTEEDQWGPSDGGYTVDNIRRVPTLHRFLRDLGLRPTYFTTQEVADCPRAADIMADLAESHGADLQAHLHPWATHPVREEPTRRNTMLGNLPLDLQVEKLQGLTTSLTRAFGRRPRAFRAGRLGFGADTATALLACGYEVDCSKSPFTDLTDMDEGPDFTLTPLHVHRLGVPGSDPADGGGIMEIPLSVGFTRTPFAPWSRVHRAFESVHVGRRPLSALLSRSGIVRKVAIEPEMETAEDMVRVALALIRSGIGHLQLLMHSPTLVPGLTPFTRSEADVRRLLESIERFVTRLRGHLSLRPATVMEFADEVRAAERGRDEASGVPPSPGPGRAGGMDRRLAHNPSGRQPFPN